MDLAHLSTNPLCSLPVTNFAISPSTGSVWIHIFLPPPLMTDSSGSSPSSPNTKPEPRYHQCCSFPNSGLSGSSCASVPLPKPDSRKRSAKCGEIIWNAWKFTYRKSQRLLLHSSHTSAKTHKPCGLQWNEKNKLKFTQICMMDLAHLSTNPLCSLPFTHFTISPSTSSVWIHIALPLPSWPVPQDPHHPHQTPSLSPGITNVVANQIHVCQGRVVLQTFCQCLTANKDLQTTWWNYYVKSKYKKSQDVLPHSSQLSSDTHMWSQMKLTNTNLIRSAWWTWHISAPILCMAFPFTQFTIPPSISSVWIYIVLPLRSWPIPQHPHHPHQTPSLSPGITNVVPFQIQVCQGRVVLQSFCQSLTADKDLQNTSWNHLRFFEFTRNLNEFYRILLILSLILTYHVVSNEMKRISSNSLRSASWTWHISAPILCVVFLSLISPFHLRLALSGSILSYLSPSWPISQNPHHPHQTPSLRPGITNVVANQIQVCQGRVVLQSLCQCLTADKDVQNTSWNHLRFFEIHIQEISTPSTACSHTSAHTDISCQCGFQWNEKNKLKFTQICIMDLAHLSTNPLCSLPFTHFTISPSIGSVWIHIALPLPSWPIPQDPHHPHQTPSLSPYRANVVAFQFQVCQGRVVLQSLCQSLTADKDLQNVVKSPKILLKFT